MKRKLLAGLLSVGILMAFTACSSTDVIGKTAVTSFQAVLNKIPDKVKSDEDNKGWSLTSPNGDRFIWSKDFSSTGTPDAMLEVDAKPFIDAGLDLAKFPKDMVQGDKIVYKAEFGNQKFSYTGQPAPIDSFKELVRTNRKVIGYHQVLDHYGVSLGNGNMFEWAKDMKTNDKDIVFVFNPQPFIDAGVQPDKVEGWVFTKVEVMIDGKPQKVDKLLRPYNLE